MCMLRNDESVLSLEPQPASEDVCMLRKAKSVLSLESQPDPADPQAPEASKARKEFLKRDVGR